MGSKLRRLRVQAGVTTKRYQRAHGNPAARGALRVVGSASGRLGIEVEVAPSGELSPESKAGIEAAFTEAVGAAPVSLPPAPAPQDPSAGHVAPPAPREPGQGFRIHGRGQRAGTLLALAMLSTLALSPKGER